MPKPREIISTHLKRLERKKPGWRSHAEMREIIKDSFLIHELKLNPKKHRPDKENPYVIAYFEGEEKNDADGRTLLKDKANNMNIFFRYSENPENLGLRNTISNLITRVRIKPYKNIRFHMDGVNPKTGERVHRAVWITKSKTLPEHVEEPMQEQVEKPKRFHRLMRFFQER